LSEKVQFNYKNTGIISGSEEKMSMAKGLGNMMRQAQMMQQKMARLQDELASQEVEASAGGGMVVARVTGKQQVVAIKIDPAAVDPEDLDMLQDLVVAAVNEAIKKSQDLVQQEMSKITGGMNIPGLF
jgi:DNA-binding YbaB/EbfC family protein